VVPFFKKIMKKKQPNIFTLSQVLLEDGAKTSEVEVLRVGVIRDRNWKITSEMLESYVKNYKDNVYGTEVQVNLEHNRGSEAAGWVTDLYLKGKGLYATVEWTEMGIDKITKKLFKFVSAELAMEYPHHKTGDLIQNVFIGLALTNTPALKGQNALSLSEIQELNQNKYMLKKYLELLKARSFVSKEEKETMRVMLEEADDAEKEEAKSDVAEVEAKPEVAPETEEQKLAREAKEKEEADAKAKADAEAAEAKAKADQNLSEEEKKFNALAEENRLLKEEKARMLTEKAIVPFLLSDDQKTGFLEAKSKDKLVNFLSSLGEKERAEALGLLAEILHVELGEIGSSKVEALKDEDAEDKKLADQKARAVILAKEKGIDLHVALSQIILAESGK
jgi:phage I-like protein